MSSRVYHIVQPYFFAPHHLHRRKVVALRGAGLDAWILALVPESLYRQHERRYQEVLAAGYTKILRVAEGGSAKSILRSFLLKQVLAGSKVLVHVLREDPSAVIALRRCPLIGRRIRFVLEYEGDNPAELVYEGAYVEAPRPPEAPPPSLRDVYERLLSEQVEHVKEADGMVLMTNEMRALWNVRLGYPVRSCILSTLADSARIHYSDGERTHVRQVLGIENRTVFVYTGNVFCKWQRLEAMCEFVSRLAGEVPAIWFLALVREDDIETAQEAVIRHGLAQRSTVIHVDESDVYKYLSASDVALFLRHDHLMNRVVTSAKLGEFLASGLPVITTGANTEMLNQFIRETGSGAFIPDSLEVDAVFLAALRDLLARSAVPGWRAALGEKTAERFSGANDQIHDYVAFIKETFTMPRGCWQAAHSARADSRTSESAKNSVAVSFLGDLSVPPDGVADGLLGSLQSVLGRDILILANIECCISDRGEPVAPKYACLRSGPDAIEGLRGIQGAVLGNNHISDYGHEATMDTLAHLQRLGVKTQGYGRNLKEALEPLILDSNGVKVGILSFVCPTTNGWNTATPVTPGVAPLSMPLIWEAIQALKSKVNAVFVYLHWGVERCHYPVPGQIRAARRIIEWGANAVIGTHSHIIQPYERYGRGYIFYGLGNAVFGDVEYRHWDQEGRVTTGVLRQRPENLESLIPVFNVTSDPLNPVRLERVMAARYEKEQLIPILIGDLSFDLDDLNWRHRLYCRVRKDALQGQGDIGYRLVHNGSHYQCDYLEEPIDRDRMWRVYDRTDRALRGYPERLLKKMLNATPFRCWSASRPSRMTTRAIAIMDTFARCASDRVRAIAVRGEYLGIRLKRGHLAKHRLGQWLIDLLLFPSDVRKTRNGYRGIFGRPPHLLRDCRTFNEKIQRAKLFRRCRRYVRWADKLAVRDYVAQRVGSGVLNELLWDGTDLREARWGHLPNQFVIKANHNSGGSIIVKDAVSFDWNEAYAKSRGWLNQDYSLQHAEWQYRWIEPRLLIEAFIAGLDGDIPLDFKFFCFSGRVELVQVDVDRFTNHTRALLDRDFNRLPIGLLYPRYEGALEKPECFSEMLKIAETLSVEEPFLRVDLYDAGRPVFGELTLHPGAGIEPFDPPKWDECLGTHWK